MNTEYLIKQKTTYNNLIGLILLSWVSSLVVASKMLTRTIDLHTVMVICFMSCFTIFVLRVGVISVNLALGEMEMFRITVEDWKKKSIYNKALAAMYFSDLNRYVIVFVSLTMWSAMGVLAWTVGIFNPAFVDAFEYILMSVVFSLAFASAVVGYVFVTFSGLYSLFVSNIEKNSRF